MDADKNLFDQAVQTAGMGPRLADDSPHRLNKLLGLHQHMTNVKIADFRRLWDPTGQHPTQTPIILDYVDSPMAGAWAFKHGNQYCIAITYGMISLLEFMFNSLLARPQFFSDLGNSKAERDDLPVIPITPNFEHVTTSIQTHNLTLADFVPRDIERQAIAGLLTHTAIRFLSAHEYRHIQAGHVDYGANNFSLHYISEMVSRGGPVERTMKRQAMERDADRFAIQMVITHIWSSRIRYFRDLSPVQFSQDPVLMLLLCIIGCSGFFRLLDDDMPPRSDWSKYSHPPSRNRRMYLLSTAFAFAQLRVPLVYTNEARDKIIVKVLESVEWSLSYLWDCKIDYAYSLMVLNEAAAYEKEIMEAWTSILNDLRKYSYIPL
jgi:hypothetical protein